MFSKQLVNIAFKQNILKKVVLLVFVFYSSWLHAQEEKTFHSLQDVLSLVKEKNYAIKNTLLQTQLASITKKTAIGNILNPKVPTSIQVLNNIDQQVSFLPGPIFGLPEGSYKEVTMGQQYVGTLSIQPQFDLLNFGNIAQLKSAKINQKLVEKQNKIKEQDVYHQVNAIYFNLLAFNAQKKVMRENEEIAENFVLINQNKYKEGLVRKQDINEALTNLITIQDKLAQIDFNIEIQKQALGLYFENDIKPQLIENIEEYENINEVVSVNSNIYSDKAKLELETSKQNLKVARLQQLPVLSFISSLNWQNLSNSNYFDSNSNWVNYNYIGLKLSWDFPTNIQKLAAVYTKKTEFAILQNNATHAEKENIVANQKLLVEYKKAQEQFKNFKKIYLLKKDTFEKSFNQYQEAILPLDKLLIAQNDMLNSQLNVISVLATIGYSKNKIEITNEN